MTRPVSTSASTDGLVAAILERDGSISLLRSNGTIAGHFEIPGKHVRAAALARDKLLLEARQTIYVLDRSSGLEERTVLLERRGRLVDAEGSLAVTVAGTNVIVTALNGRGQLTIRTEGHGPVRAQIERPGLWYSFVTRMNRGRVVFVPMSRIRHKLSR